MGLVQSDPERYRTLSIPSDDYSFDIFTQAARTVSAERSPIDPLDGLDIRHLVAFGGSQSASRLGAYINAIQPIEGLFDAFLPHLYFGGGSPLHVGDDVFNPGANSLQRSSLPMIPCRIRDDLDALVMIVNSEVEAISCYPVRQSDTERYRCWEAAGTAHVSFQSMHSRAAATGQDQGVAAVAGLKGINEAPLSPVLEAAYRRLQEWLETGTAPPLQPLIEFGGDPADVVRDEHGIARGGIRLPQVQVPLATNSAIPAPKNPLGFLGGSCIPFAPEKILALYGDSETYVVRFEQATRTAEKAGVILARDVEPLLREAESAFDRAISA